MGELTLALNARPRSRLLSWGGETRLALKLRVPAGLTGGSSGEVLPEAQAAVLRAVGRSQVPFIPLETLYLPLSSPPHFPQSWRPHLRPLAAAGEKWVSPAMRHPAGAPRPSPTTPFPPLRRLPAAVRLTGSREEAEKGSPSLASEPRRALFRLFSPVECWNLPVGSLHSCKVPFTCG